MGLSRLVCQYRAMLACVLCLALSRKAEINEGSCAVEHVIHEVSLGGFIDNQLSVIVDSCGASGTSSVGRELELGIGRIPHVDR